MKRHTACQLDDIPDGTMKAVDLGERRVLLVRHGQQVLAVRDVCPHQGARLSEGVLTGARVSAAVGDYRLTKTGQVVRCPWHNWEYDVADGRCLDPSVRLRVATYEVEIEDDRVVVIM